jgi:D-arabinose 1-dehydrogenase-like Zn-dependent alcohol dehydrogenase
MAAEPIRSTEAIVARGPLSEGNWAIENVTMRDLRDDEVLVEIVASGICHTDLHCGNTPDDKGVPAVFYPRVLGHEGVYFFFFGGGGKGGEGPRARRYRL